MAIGAVNPGYVILLEDYLCMVKFWKNISRCSTTFGHCNSSKIEQGECVSKQTCNYNLCEIGSKKFDQI